MKLQAIQTNFPYATFIQLKIVAKRKKKPLAGWIREVMSRELEKENKTKKRLADLPTYSWDVDPKLSEKIDEVVYDNN